MFAISVAYHKNRSKMEEKVEKRGKKKKKIKGGKV